MIEIPDPSNFQRVADWVELTVSTTQRFLSRSILDSVLEDAGDREPSEAFISNVWRELYRRQGLYSKPFFAVEDSTVEPTRDSTPDYLACLLFSLFGIQGVTKVPAKLFERLSCEAIRLYLSGRALVFGWPLSTEDVEALDRDESQIKQKIVVLADSLYEKFVEAPDPRFKDRGIDAVGWIPFAERRSGQVVVLLQCAAGHDWKDKLAVPMENWCRYIHWSCRPVPAFSVPCVISERDWHEESGKKGILFDRARIVNLLSEGIEDEDLQKELESWVGDQLSELSE